MHTARVASRAARLFRSTSDTATTASIPNCWHARIMRTAISPRFATKRRWMTGIGGVTLSRCCNHNQHLAELDHRSILHQDPRYHPVHACIDRAEQLHYFNQAYGIVGLHALAELDERRITGSGRPVERAEHGRSDCDLPLGKGCLDRLLRRECLRADWSCRFRRW